MLIVQRRVGERIVLTGGIEITVVEVTRRGVRLGVTAPRGIAVVRGEVHDAIVAANNAAATCEALSPPAGTELPPPVGTEP
jgi:carbon storage regulator